MASISLRHIYKIYSGDVTAAALRLFSAAAVELKHIQGTYSTYILVF